MSRIRLLAVSLGFALALVSRGDAQEKPSQSREPDELRQQMRELLARIEALEAQHAKERDADRRRIADLEAQVRDFQSEEVEAARAQAYARVPQEAIIGIVYAASTAVAILILSKIALEREEIENMLVGRLLFVEWPEVVKTAAICAAVGLIHFGLRGRFFSISASVEEARRSGLNIHLWDFVFYVTFGLVVTSSVQIAGVLLVFSYLVVPAVCSMIFFARLSRRLLAAWVLGLSASAAGLFASAMWDLPTGASVVVVFGGLLVCCVVVYAVGGVLGRVRTAAEATPRLHQ